LNILELYLITVLSLRQIEFLTIPIKKEEVGEVKKTPYVKEEVVVKKTSNGNKRGNR
jgi:stress response protein YsnF